MVILRNPLDLSISYHISLGSPDEEQGRPWIDCHKRIDLLEDMCLVPTSYWDRPTPKYNLCQKT